ncbi:MAG TPA: redoxin domain-containing protein [Arachidicoccus soli]|uniref:Thioredoxin domain-containing protein n=1 Tax=Arachidicoccus soli TaxID=2341117 RepID=A0A386HU85_9BACT|nr:redoxin domain-containing protein [Arachidicoccus soli]AYD49071.1 hypothetical protein D6B99_16470 [Arachidicoccus soli]HEU0228251.1 redoxin domain-containing protein [Arachidicoccus soli]
MKRIFLVGIVLCFATSGFGQKKSLLPLYIDGRLPNLHFPKIINYKDSAATVSDFQGAQKKMLIFDFWNTHCTVCIAQFPKEEDFQKKYDDQLQFVLVTTEPKEQVIAFFDRWKKAHHQRFSLPVIVEDTTLTQKYIRVFYQPQYAFFDYQNRLIAQTSDYFLNSSIIDGILQKLAAVKAKDEMARQRVENSPATGSK